MTFVQRLRLGFREASKGIWRKNPILFPLAIVSLIGTSALFAYIIYVQITQVNPQYQNFPPKVRQALKVAVYYTDVDLKPSTALKLYKEALRLAAEEGMHPYSDEVVGIKLKIAAMLEQAGLIDKAVKVLEQTKKEALAWVEDGRRRKDLNDQQAASKTDSISVADPNALEVERAEKAAEEDEERQRSKILRKVIGMELALATLYDSEHMQDKQKAEAAQVAAVELYLKEMQRRQGLGLPVVVDEGDGSWLSSTEVASVMNDLGQTYLLREKAQLALPLFMQALAMIREAEGTTPTCKQVVLLSLIASAMFNHPHRLELLKDPKKGTAKQSLEQIDDATSQWATKTLEVAARVQPPVRDESCDKGCASAASYLGDLAQLHHQWDEAKERYLEAKKFALATGDDEVIKVTNDSLEKLEEERKKHEENAHRENEKI